MPDVAPPPTDTLRVLLVAYHFPPMPTTGALRVARFARYLPDDVRLSVLTVRDPPEGMGNAALWESVRDRVEVFREPAAPGPWLRLLEVLVTRLPEDRFSGKLAKTLATHTAWLPDRQVSWRRPAASLGRRLVATGEVDLVLCSSPPHSSQLAALEIAESRGLPFVADFRDPWTDNPERSWLDGLQRWSERRQEARVLRGAALVLVNTPGNREMLLASFPFMEPGRIAVVPNGYDPARAEELRAARAARAGTDRGGDGRRTLLYTGHVYAGAASVARSLEEWLRREPDLPRRWRIRFVGSRDPGIERLLAPLVRAGLVELADYVPADAVLVELAAADALLYLVPPAGSSWIPSKLYDYLLAERPILAVLPRGDAWAILERSGLAELVECGTPEDEARGMAACLRRVEQGRFELTPAAEVIGAYDARRQSGELARRLRALVHQWRLPARGSRAGRAPDLSGPVGAA